MGLAVSTEQRRKVARLSAHEAAVAVPSLLIETKRLVDEIDQLPREDQLTHAATLSNDWGRLFYGCQADKNAARFAIYRRQRSQIQLLHDELDAIVNP